MTFVRTKLMLERIEPGQVLEIRLKGAEPLDNVPRQVSAQGHSVLALMPLEAVVGNGDPLAQVHRLLVRKAAKPTRNG